MKIVIVLLALIAAVLVGRYVQYLVQKRSRDLEEECDCAEADAADAKNAEIWARGPHKNWGPTYQK